MNKLMEKVRSKPKAKRKDLEGLSEQELLERLFATICPSCDKQEIRRAAEVVTADQ